MVVLGCITFIIIFIVSKAIIWIVFSYIYILIRFELGQSEAQVALEGYLLSYPAGLYFDQARTMYRTLAL